MDWKDLERIMRTIGIIFLVMVALILADWFIRYLEAITGSN